jgi:hypothetical protein
MATTWIQFAASWKPGIPRLKTLRKVLPWRASSTSGGAAFFRLGRSTPNAFRSWSRVAAWLPRRVRSRIRVEASVRSMTTGASRGPRLTIRVAAARLLAARSVAGV